MTSFSYGIEEVAPEGDYDLTNIPSQSFYKKKKTHKHDFLKNILF